MKNYMSSWIKMLVTVLSVLNHIPVYSGTASGGAITYEYKNGELLSVTMQQADLMNYSNPVFDKGYGGDHYFYYTDSKGRAGQFSCYNRNKNPTGSAYHLPVDRTGPIWYEYTSNAVNLLNSCSPWVETPSSGDANDITTVSVFVNDGWRTAGQKNTGLLSGTLQAGPAPSQCVVQLAGEMSFGLVSRYPETSPPVAESQLTVECTKTTRFHLLVNRGEELVNSDSSRIAFKYKSSHTINGGVPLGINISGTMKQVPTRPGSYKWHVPISVSYE